MRDALLMAIRLGEQRPATSKNLKELDRFRDALRYMDDLDAFYGAKAAYEHGRVMAAAADKEGRTADQITGSPTKGDRRR